MNSCYVNIFRSSSKASWVPREPPRQSVPSCRYPCHFCCFLFLPFLFPPTWTVALGACVPCTLLPSPFCHSHCCAQFSYCRAPGAGDGGHLSYMAHSGLSGSFVQNSRSEEHLFKPWLGPRPIRIHLTSGGKDTSRRLCTS